MNENVRYERFLLTWNAQSSTGASLENFCRAELFAVSYKRTVQSHELTNKYWLEFGANLHDEITSFGALFSWISFFLSIFSGILFEWEEILRLNVQ